MKIEFMETQNQVRLETLFPTFCFKVLWRFSDVDCMGGMLPYPPGMSLL